MPPIMVTGDPLICYCGKATKIYDSLFRRNFCSDECSDALRLFLGGTDKTIEIMKEVRAGDFKITGPVLTLWDQKKALKIDEIDKKVQTQQVLEHNRVTLRKLGIDEKTIDAMLEAQLKAAAGIKEPIKS